MPLADAEGIKAFIESLLAARDKQTTTFRLRVLAWLGEYRDSLSPEAVSTLQNLVEESADTK